MKFFLRHSRIKKKKEIKRILPLLLIIILLLAGGVAVGYFQITPFLRPLTQKVFAWIQHRAEAKGIGIQAPVLEFEHVHWKFPARIFWKNVSLRIHSASNGTVFGGLQGVLWASEIEVKFSKLIWGEVRVALRGGFYPAASDSENRFEFFTDQCEINLHVPWWPPDLFRLRLGRLFNEVYRILEDGKTYVPIKLSGWIRFRIFGKEEKVRIWLVKEGEEYRLVMNPGDLKRISGSYIEKVSNLEIKVLARYPLWASKALRITDKAREISQEVFRMDKDVPEDAFRHVWWSYHLTKAFGPEFSKELTDAHELGEPTNAEVDRTEADHAMDYRNNQIGSGYALRGYPEGSLLERTMTDPDVIRSVSEAYRKTGIPKNRQEGKERGPQQTVLA